MGWRFGMDYRKLNSSTHNDHLSLSFIDQMLDSLAGKAIYCFLDCYFECNQITIAPNNKEKTTFTYSYETFAFRRMSFGLYNTSDTFQMCMMAIFCDLLEISIEVFMNDFSLILLNVVLKT